MRSYAPAGREMPRSRSTLLRFRLAPRRGVARDVDAGSKRAECYATGSSPWRVPMTADPDARAETRALFFSLPSLLASRRPDALDFPIFSGEAEKLAYRGR